MDGALLLSKCLNDLTNCTTRQLEQLPKVKGGSRMVNDSSHILNELLYNKHWSSVVIIEVFGFLGLILCFAGHRLLKTVLFLAGFTVGFLVFYAFSPLIFKTTFCCAATGKREAHVGLSALFGILVAVLSLKLYRLGVFAVGQCLGLIVALSILCTPLHVYFERSGRGRSKADSYSSTTRNCTNIAYSLFMASLSCIFGSLSCKYEKPIVVITTACGGSLAFLYVESLVFRIRDVVFDGLRSEYRNWTYHATALTHYKALHFEKQAIPIFAIWCVLTVLGIVIQYKWSSKENPEGFCASLPCLNCCETSSFSKSDFA